MQFRVPKIQVLLHPNKKSPNYYLRYRAKGADGKTKEVWVSTGTKIKRDAYQKRRELEHRLEQGHGHQKDLLWKDFVTEFLKKHTARKSAGTQLAYRTCLDQFTKTMKPTWLRQIDLAMLEDFANARIVDEMRPATVNKELRHLRAALNWAKEREYLVKVPKFSPAFIRLEQTQPVVIAAEDFAVMLQAIDGAVLKHRSAGWWRVFYYLAYYLGLRRGELLGLTWDCISFEKGEITVSAATSKARKDRTLPLDPELIRLLRDWKTVQATSGATGEVLPWPADSYRRLYIDWHAIQDAAGIKREQHYVPKNCRSSCASELIRADVPTAVVKDILGHASIATTERYYINTKPLLRSAMAKRKVPPPEKK